MVADPDPGPVWDTSELLLSNRSGPSESRSVAGPGPSPRTPVSRSWREKIVMIGRGEGRCRLDKLTPSLDSGLLCWVNNTGERRRVEVGGGRWEVV